MFDPLHKELRQQDSNYLLELTSRRTEVSLLFCLSLNETAFRKYFVNGGTRNQSLGRVSRLPKKNWLISVGLGKCCSPSALPLPAVCFTYLVLKIHHAFHCGVHLIFVSCFFCQYAVFLLLHGLLFPLISSG